MTHYYSTSDWLAGSEKLFQTLQKALEQNQRVLWLVPGGSNIPITAAVLTKLLLTQPEKLSGLTISQTDERYGPIGHLDSNWQQLIDLIPLSPNVRTIPTLANLDPSETERVWAEKITKAFTKADLVVGQFGIGSDGHIAGILPHSPAITEEKSIVLYSAPAFQRITLTTALLKKVSIAFVFAFGNDKQTTIKQLQNSDLPLEQQPAQLLKQLPTVFFYSDQI